MRDFNSLGLRINDGHIFILDQEALPKDEIWLECTSPKDMVHFIKTLKIRGAPLIGVAAAIALGHFAKSGASVDEIHGAAHSLRAARPTAVNLMTAVDRLIFKNKPSDLNTAFIIKLALEILDEDVLLCQSIGSNGSSVIMRAIPTKES